MLYLDACASRLVISTWVFFSTSLKQAMQNRRRFPKALLGFGISTHCSPFSISPVQPLHGVFLPAVAKSGLPAEPFMSDGMLFPDILKFLDLASEVIED